jgi:hypothetical protein
MRSEQRRMKMGAPSAPGGGEQARECRTDVGELSGTLDT